jgi:hypothetical protein
MRSSLLAALAALALAACGGGGDEEVVIESREVSGWYLRPWPAGQYTFRTQEELDRAWSATPFEYYAFISGDLQDGPAPTYDFSKEMVIGLSRGMGTWCQKPFRSNPAVLRQGSSTRVRYFVLTNGTSACRYRAPMIMFLVVPRADGPVSFEDVSGP